MLLLEAQVLSALSFKHKSFDGFNFSISFELLPILFAAKGNISLPALPRPSLIPLISPRDTLLLSLGGVRQ